MKALIVLLMAAPALSAAAQPEVVFKHNNGVFQTGHGQWSEITGGVWYSFLQLGADSNWIYLRDNSRNLNVRLPANGGWSGVEPGFFNVNGPWTNLYLETAADPNAVRSLQASASHASEVSFRHTDGFFKPTDPGQWLEVTGGVSHQFVPLGADSIWIYLRDNSRDLNLRLPIDGGLSWWQNGPLNVSGAWTNLFEETVDAAKAPASETGFRHTNGFFKPADGGHWVDVTNGVTHNFQQLGADSDWIYLRDDSRNLNLRLPSKGGWSAWQTGALNASGVWTNLFEETPAAPSSAPPRANLVCTSGAGSTCTAWSNGVTCTQGAAAGCVAWSNGIKCVEGAGAACRKWSNGVTCTEGAGMACRKWSNGSVCVKTGKEECVEYTLNGPF